MLKDMDVEKTLSGLYVVLVDDDSSVLKAHERMLGGANYGVVTFTDSRDAAEALKLGQDIAMIVTDLEMPGLNGPDILSIAREMQPHATRMILSGNYGRLEALAASSNGLAHHYVEKPVDREYFKNTVNNGIEMYLFNRAHGIK